MARILIVYDSRTGNTEIMAQEVANGARLIRNSKVTLRVVDKATNKDLLAADAIILGSPTYYGDMSGKIKEFIDRSNKIHGELVGKVGGAFTSSGGTACGAETTLLSMLHALLIHGMIVQGRDDDKHYGATAVEAPDKEAISYCRELGKRVASLASRLAKAKE